MTSSPYSWASGSGAEQNATDASRTAVVTSETECISVRIANQTYTAGTDEMANKIKIKMQSKFANIGYANGVRVQISVLFMLQVGVAV